MQTLERRCFRYMECTIMKEACILNLEYDTSVLETKQISNAFRYDPKKKENEMVYKNLAMAIFIG